MTYTLPFPKSPNRLPPSFHIPPLSLDPSLRRVSSLYKLFPKASKLSNFPLTSSSSRPFGTCKSLNVVETVEDKIEGDAQRQWNVEVGNPSSPAHVPAIARPSLNEQAFFLLVFIACTTSIAFTGLVIAAVPTLHAIRKAAISLTKLADTARDELPSTMAAIRLSGMEISDLTLELSDLSQEIADGVSKSARAVKAAEAGLRQIGSFAHQQTLSMIQERASLPIISLQPVVAGAAEKTSRAVGHATKSFMNMIRRRELDSGRTDDERLGKVDVSEI